MVWAEGYHSLNDRNRLGRLNTYLFKKASVAIGGLVVFACCVLLLERLLRIFEVVTTSTGKKVKVPKKATFGSLSSGGLY